MQKLTITRPDDWHLHLRDGAALKAVLPHTVRQFARAIIMPNLKPPVRTVADAAAYRDRVIAAIPAGKQFEPLMTLYLTDNTSPEEIIRAKESQFVRCRGVVRQIAPRCNDRASQLISENSSSPVNKLRVDYSAVSSADLQVKI
jgi:dihydroorotase (homodimeric type)